MAFVTADRVRDTSTTAGSGSFSVSGTAPSGYRTFSAVLSVSDTFYYSIQHQTLNEWEVGLGTYSSANTFARTTIYSSSNSGSAVTFSAGTKDVFITMAAARSLQLDASGNVTPAIGGGSYTRTTFTATAGQTSFTATYTVNYVQVYVNGILLNSADYTATTGTTVVLAAAAAAGDIVDVVALNISFTSGVTASGTPASGQLAAWTSATSVQGVDSYPLWQSVQTGNFTAVAGRSYPINTTSGAVTVTLPASPTIGQIVQITDYAGTFATNNCTIARNGSNIVGTTNNVVLKVNRESVGLVYVDATQGWIAWTGFVTNPISGYNLTYLIVGAGGGSTGGVSGVNYGAGGAGGIARTSSTLSTSGGTTWTVVIGAGGAGSASTAGNGGSSSITASGSGISVTATGGNGGVNTVTTGASNADFAGGAGSGSFGAGGGAGSGAVGGSNTGGAGISSSITGSAANYGGGGGGVNSVGGSAGGAGGGGAGSQTSGVSGTANTGGGGGGGGFGFTAASGGSGVVILSIPTANYTGTTTGSPTVTTSGSNTILKFTASGSYTA